MRTTGDTRIFIIILLFYRFFLFLFSSRLGHHERQGQAVARVLVGRVAAYRGVRRREVFGRARGRLPFLSGRQQQHVPDTRVRALAGRPAVSSAPAEHLPATRTDGTQPTGTGAHEKIDRIIETEKKILFYII